MLSKTMPSPPYRPPTSISTSIKHSLAWETVSTETLQMWIRWRIDSVAQEVIQHEYDFYSELSPLAIHNHGPPG